MTHPIANNVLKTNRKTRIVKKKLNTFQCKIEKSIKFTDYFYTTVTNTTDL